MVLNEEFESHPSSSTVASLARPVDRLTAVVLDVAFILPIVALALAPLQKRILVLKILADIPNAMLTYAAATLVVWVCGLIYQSFFWSHFSATPGQLLMGLRVRSVHGGQMPIPLTTALIRSLSWWVQVALMGVPFFGIYIHPQRRPSHDRIADTRVVSVRERFTHPPTRSEQLLFSTLQSSGASMWLLFVLVTLTLTVGPVSELHKVTNFMCKEVKDSQDQLEGMNQAADRMEVAMALYASDELSVKCLEAEAMHRLWVDNSKDTSLAYLAMAFVKMNDPEVSNKYYQQVCLADSSSSSCALSQLMVSFERPRVNWEPLKIETGDLDFPGKVWAIRFANRMGQFDLALNIIKDLEIVPRMAQFIGEQRVRALIGLDKADEALLALAVSADAMNFRRDQQLKGWLCNEQLQVSCENPVPTSCEELAAVAEDVKDLLSDDMISLSLFRYKECQDPKYRPKTIGLSNSAQRFLVALNQVQESKDTTALKLLAFEQQETPFVMEARVRLSLSTEEFEDLNELSKLWRKSREVGRIWDRQAMALVGRFLEFGKTQESLQLAGVYLKQRPHRAGSIPKFVDRLGRAKTPRELKMNSSLLKRAAHSRLPASLNK